MTPAEIQGYIKAENFPVWDYRVRRSYPVLTGLFLELARNLFSDEQNLFQGVVRYDPTGTCPNSLYIESSNVWDPDSTDRRPAIIVDVGDLKYTTIASIGGAYDYDLEEGETLHHREVTGTVVFACLASVKGECVNYSANLADLIDGFSTVVRDDFCFDNFELQAILRPRLRKEQPRDWESLVQFAFKFQEAFATKLESQKLKQVSLRTVSGLDQHINMTQ